MRKVRTSMRPDLEIEVDEREYQDLLWQGLIPEGRQSRSGAEALAVEKTKES